MINKSVFIFLLLIIFCLPKFTYSSPIEDCYKEFNNKKEVSKCLDDKLKKAERSLEAKVSEIRKKMEAKSIESNQIYPIRSFNLSQQSYLIYRKTNCNWYFDKSFPQAGSSELLKNCLITMTLDRILELESSIDNVNISAAKADNNKTANIKKNDNNKVKNKTAATKKEVNITDQVSEQPDYSETQQSDTKDRVEDQPQDNYDSQAQIDVDLDDRCYIKPDPGTCEEYIMRYFYYPDGGNCSSFIWSGCGGAVPFETMAECRETCQ